MKKLIKSDNEWRKILTEEQYRVTRKHGTEPAFSGKLNDVHDLGIYKCICCGEALFDSQSKFDSGSGWPSFYAPIDNAPIQETEDNSFFMKRIEVHCGVCGSHLGHVFPDGPQPTGLRYCINSVSLSFELKD